MKNWIQKIVLVLKVLAIIVSVEAALKDGPLIINSKLIPDNMDYNYFQPVTNS